MKVLVVCQHYGPEPFRITDICEELASRGHKVTVITGIPNYPEGKYFAGYGLFRQRREISAGGVRILRTFTIPRGRGRKHELIINYLSYTLSACVRALSISKRRYDVVLAYQLTPATMMLPGLIAARRKNVRLVTYICDLWPESLQAVVGISEGIVYSLLEKLVDWMYSKSSRLLVTSRGFMPALLDRGHPSELVHYLPQYSESVYKAVEVPENDPIRLEVPKGFIVTFTGNIGFAQGLETLLEAARLLADVEDLRWVIIGEGRARPYLERMARAAGLRDKVLFLGRKPMERIPYYLALSDLAFVSLGKKELFALTLPAKVQSYLACGIPIVGSVDGETAMVIEESGAGLAAPAGDVEELVRNILRLKGMPRESLDQMAAKALAYHSASFRKDSLVQRLEAELQGRCD